MNRLLIINADDLGLSEEVNSGILSGFKQGIIGDTSLLAKAPFAAQAVSGLRELGILHAGIHINIDELFGWKPGGIELKPRPVLMELLKDQAFLRECRQEAEEQIRIFLSFGLIPSHLDTHHHVHGLYPVFEMLMDLLSEFRIPALRFSRHGYLLSTRKRVPFDEEVYFHMEDMLRRKGIFTCSHFLEGAGKVNDATSGITELVVHPSLGGDPWRVQELENLQAQAGAGGLAGRGIELTCFKDARERGSLDS